MNLTLLILNTALLLSGPTPVQTEFLFKIYIEKDGIYRVNHADFGQSDLALRSAGLTLSEQGLEVPIHIEDGGDGVFDSGDYFVFSGQRLNGESSWFNQFSRYNIYRLRHGEGPGPRLQPADPIDLAGITDSGTVLIKRHLEQENNRVALPRTSDDRNPDSWYWKRLSHLDSRPFEIPLEATPNAIRIGLTGMSRDRNAIGSNLSQHMVNISVNNQTVANEEWNGQNPVVIEIQNPITTPVPPGKAELTIKIPRRQPAGSSSSLIDVVLLNWVKIEFPFSGNLPDGFETVFATDSNRSLPLPVQIHQPPSALQLFSPSGLIYNIEEGSVRNLLLNENGSWQLIENHVYLTPSRIATDKPASLTTKNQQADYLVMIHASLIQAIEPLVEFHRSRGLRVTIAVVEDIYNDFNHGIPSPIAIRNFIQYASSHWQSPSPRYVLLAGDAAWNNHDPSLTKNNLVPTMQAGNQVEFAASDNGFVVVDDNHWKPQLAIGRLPARNPQELSEMVEKIIDYHQQSNVGPWRRNVAWVTDRNPGFQDISNHLADNVGLLGFSSSRVYPASAENDSTQDQAALLETFDQGKLIVHFLGHGGRFVWRTGPPDYHKSTDLFSIEDVKSLSPGNELPFVLSMTCSSGPFDHPEADSIAEAFLRLPGSGAIAVLAASWRIPASREFSTVLIKELLKPGISIGEAVMFAKQKESNRALVESYNLLGDPALQLNRPGRDIELSVSESNGQLSVSFADELLVLEGGQAIIDWMDSDGSTLRTERVDLSGNELEFHYSTDPAQKRPTRATVYAWNTTSNRDGLGIVNIP